MSKLLCITIVEGSVVTNQTHITLNYLPVKYLFESCIRKTIIYRPTFLISTGKSIVLVAV